MAKLVSKTYGEALFDLGVEEQSLEVLSEEAKAVYEEKALELFKEELAALIAEAEELYENGEVDPAYGIAVKLLNAITSATTVKEKENAISSIKTLMSQVGISSEELNNLLAKGVFTPQVKSRNVPPKYRFSDEFGNSHTWTGQGRTPTIFVECMKREGKNKDDYLI